MDPETAEGWKYPPYSGHFDGGGGGFGFAGLLMIRTV